MIEKPLKLEGKFYLTPDNTEPISPQNKAKGIFIYDCETKDIQNLKTDELGDAAFVIARAQGSDAVESLSQTIAQYEQSNSDSKLMLSLAFVYTGVSLISSPNGSPAAISNYAKLFTSQSPNGSPLKFRPILCLEKSFVERETKAGLEYNVLEQLNYLETTTKLRPIIHTSYAIANTHLTDDVFEKYPIWVTFDQQMHKGLLPDLWRNARWFFLETEKFTESGEETYNPVSTFYSTNTFNETQKELEAFGKVPAQASPGSRTIRLK